MKKIEKNSESSPGCILRFLMVLDLLGRSKPIKTQHFMIFRHFEIILIGILMILRQILFNRLESLIFFENFLRDYLKFVYLWKISTLSINIFPAVRNFCLTKFWDFFSNSGQSLLRCSQICLFLVNFSISHRKPAYLGKDWSEFEKNLRIWSKKDFGLFEIYSCSKC